MDLASRLLLLLEVNEYGSFTRVSEQHNVNRSVISKQISHLEKDLGVRLLNRTTRSLSLTTAGTEMINQAFLLRDVLADTKRIAQIHQSEPIGMLRISSSMFFGRQYIQSAITEFQNNYPQINIELRLEDRLVDIIAEGFDIGFRTGEPKSSSLISTKIARNRLLIVAAPKFIKRYGNPESIVDFESLPAVAYSAPGLLIDKFKYFDEYDNQQYLKLNVAYKTNEIEVLADSAASGNMVAVVTAQMVGSHIKDKKLVPIMTHLHLGDWGTFYAVYPHRDPPLKTKLFIKTLKSIIGERAPVWENQIPGFEKMYGY